MQKSNTTKAVNAHRRVGVSTTLNRKYVRRPQVEDEIIQEMDSLRNEEENFQGVSPMISHFNERPARATRTIQIQDDEDRRMEEQATELAGSQKLAQAIRQQVENDAVQTSRVEQQPAQALQVEHPMQTVARERIRQRRQPAKKLSAKQIKDQEIKKALATTSKNINKDIAKREKAQKRAKLHFGIARVMLAISCTAAAVMAIMYFVNTNMPDISMRVTAMQTGVNASYPGYVPRGYTMTNLSSENGKITMNFHNRETDQKFTLVEESSSWDSNALLTNYVKPEMGDNYTIVREQGLTIYTTDNAAAWVNGGVAYRLTTSGGALTKKQIKSIAVSM